MSERKLSVVIIGARDEVPAIRRQIDEVATVLAVEADPALGLGVARQHAPDVGLFFIDHDKRTVLDLARQVAAQGLCAVVIVSRQRDPDNILVAMRSGAKDFAYLDEDGGDVRRALVELVRAVSTPPSGQRGKVITVFSAKGGSGATTIALNLAGALAKQSIDATPLKVALVDLNLEMGDVLVFLDMTARYSFQELLGNMHRLDAELLYSSMARHSSGVYVMSQTDYLEEGRDLSAADAGVVLAFLRHHFDFVVIDGLRDFGEIALTALDKADHIILALTQDIPSLKNANRCLRLFARLGYDGNRLGLALNRFRGSAQLTPDAIADALGRKVNWTIANDFPSVIRAVNEGKLLIDVASSSRTAKDVFAMVPDFHEAAPVKRRSLFSRWGKG